MWVTVLSLFDWISCWMIALRKVGVDVDIYYSSEIDKYATQISEKNYPNIIKLGDINNRENRYLWNIDILIGWSPCQWFSFAGKQLAFDDPRSKLFFQYVRILKEVKPKYFLLENVRMKKEFQNIITDSLFGIEPVEINSALVSAQNRKRLYRVGSLQEDGTYKKVDIPQPQDRWILLKDIIEHWLVDRWKSHCIDANYSKGWNVKRYTEKSSRQIVICNTHPSWRWMNGNVYSPEGKSPTITTNKGEWLKIIQMPRGFNKWWIHEGKSPTMWSSAREENNKLTDGIKIRKLTPVECERLQTIPDNYTEGVSNSQRYKMLWNARTVDVIVHIFKHMFFYY